jgi:hypothetical protein
VGSNGTGPNERYDVIQSDKAHDELMKNDLYRRVYAHGTALIDQGHNPLAVALALNSLVTVILEGVAQHVNRSSKRTD